MWAAALNICSECWSKIVPWTGAICARCGLPFPSGEPAAAVDSRCGQCRHEEYEFDYARSSGPYISTLRAAILQLKFQRRERLAKKLGELLANVWYSNEGLGEGETPVLVPVPLHVSRERERGFNQSELLAKALSRRLRTKRKRRDVRVEVGCLVRTRPTAPQTSLSLAARRDNVRGVFAVSRSDPIRGRLVVLIDDVMTTGTTLSACALALKRAGARRVIALTLARATPQFPDALDTAHYVSVDELGAGST
jgi:ComF family protein